MNVVGVHRAVAGVFFAFGASVGLWGGASGAILTRVGVDPAAFGMMLTAYTAAYLAAMSAGGALVHRFGVRSVLRVSAALFGAVLCGLLEAWSAAAVAAFLIVSGFVGGIVDVTMNAEGARIERRLGRPLLARLHAAASAGLACGAILGSLILAGRAPWAAGPIAFFVLGAAGLAYGGAAAGEGGSPPPSGRSARGLSFAPALIGLGLLIGVSVAAETAALLWSSLLLRDEAPRLAAVSGLGAAFFALCQAALRFNADSLRLWIDDRRIVVASFVLAALGFAVVAAGAGFFVSVVGFALIGIGTGAIVPCSFALVAAVTPGRPAVGLASASLFSAVTRLPAPLALGAIAQGFSLPVAFGAFAAALVAAGVGMALFDPTRDGDAPTPAKE